MLDDLRHFRPSDCEDSFQIIDSEFAGWLLAVSLILTAIVEGL